MNIILLTNGRLNLTAQTLTSAMLNASNLVALNWIVVMDYPCDKTVRELIWDCCRDKALIISAPEPLGVGGGKNLGASFATKGKPLCFLDNDLYLLPNWDAEMLEALHRFPELGQVGGWQHPFHGTRGIRKRGHTRINLVDAVMGGCMAMRWEDWEWFGPFAANATGPGQSEDFALSQKIQKSGMLSGVLNPMVAIHCGLTNCKGEPAVGSAEMKGLAERQVEAYKLGEGVILE